MHSRIWNQTICKLIVMTLLLTTLVPSVGMAEVVKEQDPSALGYGGAAATEDPDASKAAMTILKKGGNAVDAAIAAAAAQGVTRPYSGGIGGDGMMLIYLAEKDEFVVLDHRSISSQKFGGDSYLNPDTGLIYPEATRISSGMAVAVPGVVKAWEEALDKYGTMSLAEVLQPAIEIAENGFIADSNYVRETRENAARFNLFPATREVFLDENGQAPEAGTLVKNPDLAKTYRLIAEHGSKIFYEGEIAQAIVDTVNNPQVVENPDFSRVHSQWDPAFGVLKGNISLDDLKTYRTTTREPVKVNYRGYDVYGLPPGSSGGITVGEALNIVEAYDLANLPRAQALHYYLEATRYAFADRRAYIGDPDLSVIPVAGLLSKGFAAERRQKIKDDQASVGQVAPGNPWPYEEDPDKWPEPPTEDEHAFYYNFEGNNGEIWDSSKFHRLDTGPASSPDDAQFDLYNNSGRIQLNVRKEGRGSAYGRAAANMEPLINSEMLVRFKTDTLDNDQRLRFWLRADTWRSGSTTPNNGYGIEINLNTNELVLIRTKDGTLRTLERFPYQWTTDWQTLRFQVVDDQLLTRIWDDEGSEPGEWQIIYNLTESDRHDNQTGTMLLSAVNFEYDQTVNFYIDEVTVNDLGDQPATPPEEPEQPGEPNEPSPLPSDFYHDFRGENGWDTTKFNLLEHGVTFHVYEDSGKMQFNSPPGSYATSFGKIEPIMDEFTNGELLLNLRIEEPERDRRIRLWLRAEDWDTPLSTVINNVHGVEINTNSNRLSLQYGSTVLSQSQFEWTDEWMWLRVRAEEDHWKIRLWKDGENEPKDWLIEQKQAENRPIKPGKVLMGAHGWNPLDGSDSIQFGEIQITNLDHALNELKNVDSFLADSAEEAENLDEGREIVTEGAEEKPEESTIHLAVTDRDGNIVSYTNTIVSIGGNGMVVPGYGFLLNNSLYGRIPTQHPSHPNYPRPGMRPLSSMSATIVMKDGKPVMTIGAPGSDTIITTVLQIILNHLDFKMTLPEAIASPRINQRNNFDGLADYEQIFISKYPNADLPVLLEELEKMGHQFRANSLVQGIGAAVGIEFLEDGRVRPATEPVRRGGGSAMVESTQPNVPRPGHPGRGGSGSRGGSDAALESSNSALISTSGRTVSINGATIVIPAHSFGSDFTITVTKSSNVSGLSIPTNMKLISDVFNITKDKQGNFQTPVKITLPFDKSKVDLDNYDIAIFWYNEETDEWIALDNVEVNISSSKVSGEIDHLTKFAVLAVEKEVTDSEEKMEEQVEKQAPVHLTDIQGHWAQENIEALVKMGAINGYPNGTFLPNHRITRAEFATVLVKALGLEANQGIVFADTANHWAREYIATATAHGITAGYNESTFGPNDLITREQMAAMIVRATKLEATENGITFSDHAQISDWAKDAIQVAAQAKLITGYPDHSFQPQGEATRAEAVSVIIRALNY